MRNSSGNFGQKYGLTEPISVAGLTDFGVIKNRELEEYLASAGVYESREEASKREEVLGRLNQIVKKWIKNVSRSKGYNEQVVQEANAKIFTFGSYRLGVHGPGADIDTLCVGPIHATRNEDFFGRLQGMLAEMPEVQELHPVPNAFVPVMKFKFDGVSIDLLYANVALYVIPEDLDLTHESILLNVDEQTARSLNGCRVTDRMLRLIPNIQNFRTALRCLRLWAKQQGVYSNIMGFLGGINLALLVARVCQLYPNALPSILVSQFFKIYNMWKWPNPVMLCPIQQSSLRLNLPFWDPTRNYRDGLDLMPIITPAYPCMNSSYNVSQSTLRFMKEEFQRGHQICEAIEGNKDSWTSLFKPFAFFSTYKYYLQIAISAGSDDDMRNWKGWVESKIRLLTKKIERVTHGQLHCRPYPVPFFGQSIRCRCCYFMGLQGKQGSNTQEAQVFDITMAIKDFNGEVCSYALRKPRMFLYVCNIRRKDLPSYVFPGGVKPPKLPRSDLFQTSDVSKKRRSETGGLGPGESLPSAKSSRAEGFHPKKPTENIVQQPPLPIVGHQGASNVLDEIKNESEMINQISKEDILLQSFKIHQGVELVTAGPRSRFLQDECLEELEPLHFTAMSSSLASSSSYVAPQKPLLRVKFTSLNKASGDSR